MRLNRIMAAILLFSILITSFSNQIDADISKDVKNTLPPNIGAEVEDGVVTLTGKFRDTCVKKNMQIALGKIKGVKQVIDETTVAPFTKQTVVVASSKLATGKSGY